MKNIRENGPGWEVRKKIRGVLYREQFASLEHAKLWLRKLELDRDLGKLGLPRTGAKMTVASAGEMYLEEITLRYAEATVEAYRYRWAAFVVPELGDRRLCDITTADLEAFLSKRLAAGVTPNTVDHDRVLLCSFFSWCARLDYLPSSPAARVKRLAFSPLRERRALTPAEVQALAAALEPESRLALLFAVYSGLRASEMCRVRWEDVDFERRRMTIRSIAKDHTKTHRPRVVPIHQVLLEELRRAPRPSKYVVPGARGGRHTRDLRGIIEHGCAKTGIAPFRWHDLRHTFATWLRRAKTPLADVAALLGHSDLRSTQIYAHEDLDDLTAFVDKLPGAADPADPGEQRPDAVKS